MGGRPVLRVLIWLAFLAISVATPENVERVRLGSEGVGEGLLNAILDVGLDSHVRGLKSNNACPAGSIYDTALTACSVICAGGKYRNNTGSTTLESIAVVGSCKKCAPGTARDTSDTVLDACAPCPVGTSNARPGQVTCIPCSLQGENVYANETGAVVCTPCPQTPISAQEMMSPRWGSLWTLAFARVASIVPQPITLVQLVSHAPWVPPALVVYRVR